MANIIPIFVPHEGCPHDCIFCNQRRIAVPVSPEPEDVRERVCAAIAAGLASEVAFYGGSFTAIPSARQEALLGAVYDLGIPIRISTRPDCINAEVIDRLLRYNVTTVELGAQSMNDEVLKLANRGHTASDVTSASKLLKAAGFKLILQAMTGLPCDSGTWRETARALAELEPDGARIYPVVVIRETELYDMWERGEYTPLSVSEGADAAADMLEVFIEHGIPVIRIGLNPTEELSGGAAVAGAYHPALGEMTRSRIFFRNIIKSLTGADITGQHLSIFVPRGRISQSVGVSRENIEKLRGMGAQYIKFYEDETLDGYQVRTLLV